MDARNVLRKWTWEMDPGYRPLKWILEMDPYNGPLRWTPDMDPENRPMKWTAEIHSIANLFDPHFPNFQSKWI